MFGDSQPFYQKYISQQLRIKTVRYHKSNNQLGLLGSLFTAHEQSL